MASVASTLATLCILVAGTGALWLATDAGVNWTAESARRQSLTENPPQLENAYLRDSNGHIRSLQGRSKRYVLVDFIYTQCPTVCISLGDEFRQLQSDIVSRGFDSSVELLSISFDPSNDGPAELANYLDRFSADTSAWQAARFERNDELEKVLNQLEVIVIPERTLGFVHNAAIYLLKDLQLVGIYDLGDRKSVLETLEWHISKS